MESTESVLYQGAVTKYASVGALSVLIWDILDNIPADYRMLFKKRNLRKKLSLPNCVYVCSRIGALAYQLSGVIFSTAPVKHCALLDNIAYAWCPFSIGATGLLFFLRLRAVYMRNRLVVAVFFVLWIGLLISAILLPIGIKGGAIGESPYCTDVSFSKVAFYSQLFPLVFDTLVFIAISWRLSHIGKDETGLGVDKNTINNMVFGTNLRNFIRSLLIDGQIYYLLTIIPGVISAVLVCGSLLQEPLAYLLQDSYLVLVNIMACRVFRHTKSETLKESEISTSTSAPIQFRYDRSSSVVSEESLVV